MSSGGKNQHQLRTADLENKGLSSPTMYHTDEETKAQKHWMPCSSVYSWLKADLIQEPQIITLNNSTIRQL